MELPIGTTLDGHRGGFDTASTRPLVLVGDAGRGKTTCARFITRWWLAKTTRHAHVFATWPTEWADLRCHLDDVADLVVPVATGCTPRTCLVVVDDINRAPDGAANRLPLGATHVIITSNGGCDNLEGLERSSVGISCLGLVPRDAGSPFDAGVAGGQGRLDWPPNTVPIYPDQRGELDFPCHRWRAPDLALAATRMSMAP